MLSLPPLQVTAEGLSLVNAYACAMASRLAYTEIPTLTGARDTQVSITDCDGALVIAFRGTQEVRDFLTDAQCWREDLLEGGEVHNGFYESLQTVIGEVAERASKHGVRAVFITGHSLGGALAMLCAEWFAHHLIPVHSIYTFGQPRVGDGTFASEYNSLLLERTFRFVHEEDVVPRVPGVLIGYRHAGTEIFLPSTGGMVVNPTLWKKAKSGIPGAFKDLRHGRLAFLSDHHMDNYLRRVHALAAVNESPLPKPYVFGQTKQSKQTNAS